ncbi:MAG: adenosylcobinamide-GDP ribazoletransferase [Rhizomicrobium sp.]
MTAFLPARLDDIRLGMTTLTRLPMGRWPLRSGATLRRSVWTYPLAGAVVGAVSGLAFQVAALARLSPLLCAALALVVNVLVTGSFHEDGLADFFDGIGGGRDRAHKLEVMRDSRIGTYGATALILSFLVRWAALATLAAPATVMTVWIAAGALSRAGIVVPLRLLAPARPDGLGVQAASPPAIAALVAALGALAIAVPVLRWQAAPVILGVLLASLLVTGVAHRQLGGFTGDVLGACALIGEAAALVAASAGWM